MGSQDSQDMREQLHLFSNSLVTTVLNENQMADSIFNMPSPGRVHSDDEGGHVVRPKKKHTNKVGAV